MADVVREYRRLILRGADDDAGGVDHHAIALDPQGELRNVHLHVEGTELFGFPAPALHVGHDVVAADIAAAIEGCDGRRSENTIGCETQLLLGVLHRVEQGLIVGDIDLGVGGAFRNVRCCHAEALAQERHAVIVHAELERLAVRDGDLLDDDTAVVEFGQR